MVILFTVLAALCLIAMITGIGVLMYRSGKVTERRGSDVGAEIMNGITEDEDELPGKTVYQKRFFKGTGYHARWEAGFSISDIKQAVAEGDWQQAWPMLATVTGLFGMLLSGAMALFLYMDDKLVGGFLLLTVVYTVTGMLWKAIRNMRNCKNDPHDY